MTTRGSYARRLGLCCGTMAVIGGIIGSGIFATPNVGAQRVGTAGLALGPWILGGVHAPGGGFFSCAAGGGEGRKGRAGRSFCATVWAPSRGSPPGGRPSCCPRGA